MCRPRRRESVRAEAIGRAVPDHVPKPLVDQLAPGGRMVIPVGRQWQSQELLPIEKQKDGTVRRRKVAAVAFVPMTGEGVKGERE